MIHAVISWTVTRDLYLGTQVRPAFNIEDIVSTKLSMSGVTCVVNLLAAVKVWMTTCEST